MPARWQRAERMRHDGQELDVREAHPLDVRHERVGEFRPCEQPIALLGLPAPRGGVHFVDGHRAIEPDAGLAARPHPRLVAPRVPGGRGRDGCRARRNFRGKRVRIRLGERRAEGGMDLELVVRSGAEAGDEALPQPAGAERFHGVGAAVPAVEIADHGYRTRVRRPDDEGVAALIAANGRPRAQLLPRPQPVAFAEEVGFVVGYDAARIRCAGLGWHAPTVSEIASIGKYSRSARRISR